MRTLIIYLTLLPLLNCLAEKYTTYIENRSCIYYLKVMYKHHSILHVDTCKFDEQMVVEINGLTDKMKKDNNVRSGKTSIHFPKAVIRDGKINLEIGHKIMSSNGVKSDDVVFSGKRTALAIKVDALDTSTTSSAERISDKIFGTGNDKVNLKSQISDCSFEQLNIVPFIGTTLGGENISGVGELFVPFNLKSNFSQHMENIILELADEKYGKLEDQIDHLLLILPKGSADFVAYAYMFGFLSVYNDEVVTFPSITMHEIGHNLGFGHSGKDKSEYGDEVGFMGFGTTADDDSRCFNAQKSWITNWYKDGHKIINPFQGSFKGNIVGIANYDQRGDNTIIIKVVGHDDGNDYFVNFNRKVGINRNSIDGEDQLIITSAKATDRSDAISKQVKKLSEGEVYVINNFGGGRLTLYVKVNYIALKTPAYANVSIILKSPEIKKNKLTKKCKKKKIVIKRAPRQKRKEMKKRRSKNKKDKRCT